MWDNDASPVSPDVITLKVGTILTATWDKGQLTHKGTDKDVRDSGPGTTITLDVAFGGSNPRTIHLTWTAETTNDAGLDQRVRPDLCEIQFSQRCILSPSGFASWSLSLPANGGPMWAVTSQKNFRSPNNPVTPCQIQLELGALRTEMQYDGTITPQSDQPVLNFLHKFKADVSARCGANDLDALRYVAVSPKLLDGSHPFDLGSGVTLSRTDFEVWQETTYDPKPTTRGFNAGFDKITTENVLNSWTTNVARHFYEGLSVEHDFTLLPELSAQKGKPDVPWSVVIRVEDGSGFHDDPGSWTWIALDGTKEFQPPVTPEELKTALRTQVVSINATQSVAVTAAMPMFRTQDGMQTLISSLELSTKERRASDPAWSFVLAGTGWSNAGSQVIRAGAFELYLPADSADLPLYQYQLLCTADFGVATSRALAGPVMPVVFCQVTSLPLFDVAPAGEDDLDSDRYAVRGATQSLPAVQQLADDRKSLQKCLEEEIADNLYREGALVFRNPANKPTDDGSWTRDGSWTLDFTEQSSPSLKRTVIMNLRFTASSSVSGPRAVDESVIVLDRLPFTFAEVHFHPLTESGTDANANIVATWNKASNSWKIAKMRNSPSYLVLPPQTVGEEFVTSDAGDNYPRGIGPGAVGKPQLTLGTPALVTTGTDDRLNYVDVPWNLRRLVTDHTLSIQRFDSEMLYGLACSTVAPHMQLTEAETLYGRLRGALPLLPNAPAGSTYNWQYLNARLHWSRIYREYQSRLGVFVLADATQPDQERFADTKNTLCDLRLDSMPTDENATMKPYWSPSRISPEFRSPSRFKGGALEGIENEPIFTQVRKASRSDAGSTAIIDPRVTVLGGFGTIRAGFGNSKLTNTISAGRTMTYTVERLGRIGAHWNRAKHVIVYQRTVFPSRQFFSEQQRKSAFPGYPLVRKVEEYVEFLEPERVYGEETAGAQTSFLKAFKCGDRKRFAVNSGWGSTIPDEGLTIPLWNAAAALDLPDVYPKPQFYLEVSTPEPALDSTPATPKFITQDSLLLNPAEVVFYTSTRETSTDTDTWSAVAGIDYVRYPLIVPDAGFYDSGDLEQVPLPEFDVPPGWDAVTFTIKPPATGVHSTDGIVQTTKPIGARVRKVTVSRGFRASPVTAASLFPEKNAADFKTFQDRALELAAVKLGLAGAQKVVAAQLAKATQEVNEVSRAAAQAKEQLDKAQVAALSLSSSLQGAANGLSATVTKPFTDAATKLIATMNARSATVAVQLKALSANVARLVSGAQAGFDFAQADVVRANHVLQVIAATVDEDVSWTTTNAKTKLDAAVRSWSVAIEEVCGTYSPLRPVAAALSDASLLLADLNVKLNNLLTSDAQTILTKSHQLAAQFDALVAAVRRGLVSLQADVPQLDPTLILLILDTDGMSAKVHGLEQAAQSAVTNQLALADLQQAAKTLLADLQGVAAKLNTLAGVLPEATFDLLRQYGPIQALYAISTTASVAALQSEISKIKAGTLVDALPNVYAQWVTAKASVAQQTSDALISLGQQLAALVASQGGALASLFGNLQGQLSALAGALPELKTLQKQLDGYTRGAQAYVQSAQQTLNQYVRQPLMAAANMLPGGADNVLRTVHALGEPPEVPQLELTPPVVAYVYDYANSLVPITPMLARAHQVDQALNALGVKMPAVHLGDVLIPPALPKFNLTDILPNFAGLKLGGLFSGIRLPPITQKQIALTHSWEPQLRRGWLQADVNLPMAQRMVVFQSGFLSFCLREATFVAHSRVATDNGHVQQSTNGSITGTWSVEIGDSSSLIDFAETSLTFDDSGKLDFHFSPSKLRLSDALKAVTALVQRFIDPKSGFTYGATDHGVKCAFALPFPDTAALTSGFTGLKFSTSLELDFSAGFVVKLAVGVSSKDRPFNFAVFILGGCGYLQAGAAYDGSNGAPTPTLEMAIGCSGGLAIALGPISGSIYAQFAIELRVANRGFCTGAFFQITGHVSILGIISVDLVFRLEATYEKNTITASGHFSIEIKLFMFSVSVSRDVSMHLGSGGQGRLEMERAPGYEVAALAGENGFTPGLADAFAASENWAQHYVDMLI